MPETKRPLKVFLCHASADKPKVRELYRYLRRRGIKPWFDEVDLVGGQDWQVEIPKALLTSDAIIICLTKNSVDKEGYVQKEIKFALDKALEMPEGRIFVIPVRFEECKVPFSLSRYQWVDLFEHNGFPGLMKALKTRANQLERTTVDVSESSKSEPNLTTEQQELELEKLRSQAIQFELYGKFWDALQVYYRIKKMDPLYPRVDVKIKELEKELHPKLKAKSPTNIVRIVALIGAVATFIAAILSSSLIEKWLSSSPEPTITITTTDIAPAKTFTPTVVTPEIVFTPISFDDPHPDPSDYVDNFGVSMRLVPEGEFTMGSDNGESDEKPVHTVYLDSYYIDKYEVTNGFYKACVDAGVCLQPQNTSSLYDFYGKSEYANYPVMSISWNMAKTYCEWRGAQLPTEAQWEKAARGTDGRTYPWGEEIDQTFANYDQSAGRTSVVGAYEKGKSPYGTYDMAGNMWEWVSDWYSKTFYANSPTSNPSGPGSGQSRVLRGGTWYYGKERVRTFSRDAYDPTQVLDSFGFRCAKNATP